MPDPIDAEIRELRARFWSLRDPAGRAFAPLADAYRRNGALEKALEVLSDGTGRLPDFTPGHVVAGWVHRDLGDWEASADAFRRALELDEGNVEALRGLAECSAALSDREGLDDALTRLRVWSGVEGDWSDELRERVEVEAVEAFETAAEDRVEEAVEESPDADDSGWFTEVGADLAGDPDRAPSTEAPSGSPGSDFGEALTSEVSEDLSLSSEELSAITEAEGTGDLAAEAAAVLSNGSAAHLDEDETDWSPDEEGDVDVYTRTMAEVYARQGLVDRAIHVYRALLEADPHNEELAARLQELEAAPGPGAVSEPEVISEPEPETLPEPETPPRPETVPVTDIGPDRPVVPVADLAPDRPVVPVATLAPERPVVPIVALAPDTAREDDADPFGLYPTVDL